MLRVAPVLMLVALSSTVAHSQQIFKTTDEHGNVVFTDQPPSDSVQSERVELQQTNTTPATPLPPKATPEPTPEAPELPDFQTAITAPANETTIAMGPGNFSVSASVTPSLVEGTLLQLQMDGAPWGEPQKEASWNLTNVFRGQHDISVAVVDEGGQQLAVSEPVRVYVLRPSINSPARRSN